MPSREGEKMTFREQLVEMDACAEAVEWVGDKTLAEAWATCERADWMLWLVSKIDGSYSPRLRLAACACARTALKYVTPGDERPRLAIECAERYAIGEATQKELDAARDAARAAARTSAWAAARAAAGAAAGTAAWAAAGAAARDAAWAVARDAAWTAAGDAAWAAARDAARDAARAAAFKEMADLVRQIIPEVRHAKP